MRLVGLLGGIRGEHDENEVRKDFTPSERVAIVGALASTDGPGRPDNSRKCGNIVTVPEASRRAGFSSEDQYNRARSVVTQGTPALVEAMDSGRVSISAHHRRA